MEVMKASNLFDSFTIKSIKNSLQLEGVLLK